MTGLSTLKAKANLFLVLPAPELRRAIRKRAGLAQRDIAEALGVQSPTVSRWETGEREPRGAHRAAYAAVLDDLLRLAAAQGER